MKAMFGYDAGELKRTNKVPVIWDTQHYAVGPKDARAYTAVDT